MAAPGTAQVLIASVVCLFLTLGSCYIAPGVGMQTGLCEGYGCLMPMIVGAYVFAPLSVIFVFAGLVGSLFPSKEKESDEPEPWNPYQQGESDIQIPEPVSNNDEIE